MLVSGILQCVFWVSFILVAISHGVAQANQPHNNISMTFVMGFGCIALLTALPLIVMNILVIVEWDKSDKECGPSLYNYGVFIVVSMVLQCLSSSTGSRANRN